MDFQAHWTKLGRLAFSLEIRNGLERDKRSNPDGQRRSGNVTFPLQINRTMSRATSLFTHWQKDIPASVVVFLVALPLCLGIALASGAPLFSGLISGIVGGLVVGALSGSQLSVSGPAAGLAVVVLGAIQSLPSFEIFLLAVFLAGIFQLAFASLGAGVLSNFIPTAVIKGMLSAIGIILILKQIPHAVGWKGLC